MMQAEGRVWQMQTGQQLRQRNRNVGGNMCVLKLKPAYKD